jgi:hypothetical protein
VRGSGNYFPDPKPLLGVLQQRRIASVCSKAWHSKPLEDLTLVLVEVLVVYLIMQLIVHVQVHIEVADIVKEQLNKLYKHTHPICELWMLSTFISNSYTTK